MNIKEAEKLTGVSSRNIRFYEQKGLLRPTRNKDNDYREYSDADIRQLKLIRMLRMLDMPLEQIKEISDGAVSLPEAIAIHRQELVVRKRRLDTAIRFCDEFPQEPGCDLDELLRRMEAADVEKRLFTDWCLDYLKSVLQSMALLLIGVIPSLVGLGSMIMPAIYAIAPALGLFATICLLIGWAYVGYIVTRFWGKPVRNTVLAHLFISLGLLGDRLYNEVPGIREVIEEFASLSYGFSIVPMRFLFGGFINGGGTLIPPVFVVSPDYLYCIYLLLLAIPFLLGSIIAVIHNWKENATPATVGQ